MRNFIQFISAGLATLVLSACATPPGQLKKDEMDWTTINVAQPYSTVFTGLQEYARTCGGLLAESQPSWYPGIDGKHAKIDLYLPNNLLGGRSEFVFGIVTLEEDQSGSTTAKIGVQTVYSKPLFKRRGWWVNDAQQMFEDIEAGRSPTCS